MTEEELGKTALTAANSELYAATQKLDAVVRASPHAIITHGLHGRVDTWNRAAEQLFGWRTKQVLGRRPADWGFVHPLS